MKFTDMGLSPDILDGIAALGFETPTAVQAEVIPFLLESDRDLVALAQTGTGKTAAFGLPSLETLDRANAVPQVIVLCPTRELCVQITKDLKSYAARQSKVRIVALYGGTDIRQQISKLQSGAHIIVATPGRMLDIIRRKRVDLSSIERVVLDEADEMLNMGFAEELEGILSNVPDGAQTLLFSATMPKEVARISRNYMKNPNEITVGSRNAGAENVSHEYYVVHAKDRYSALRRIVDCYSGIYGIVFCRTRIETQQVADKLRGDGYNAEALHGDLTQQQRDAVMKKFRTHQVQLLVATDVAARGLDINDLTHVVNYNLPDDLDSYTHRSGRTGRAGKNGISVTIIHMREHFKIDRIQKSIGRKFEHKSVPSGEDITRVRLLDMARRVRDTERLSCLTDKHLEELSEILSDLSKEEIIARFACSEMHRMLQFYRNAPDLNVSKSQPTEVARKGRGKPQSKGGKRGKSNPPRNMKSDMTEIVMNVGKVNGLTPKTLMSMVNLADRESSVDIGRINIAAMQAYFEVPNTDARGVIDSFAKSKLDCSGRLVKVALVGDKNSRTQNRGSAKRNAKSGRNRKYPPKKYHD